MQRADLAIFLNSFPSESNFIRSLVYFLADPFALILLTFVIAYFLLVKKDVARLAIVALAILVSATISELLKFSFGYERPFVALADINPLFMLGGYDSFPSGHAIVFAAVATAMHIEDRRLGAFFIAAAILIGASRVISGVHYIEDVLAGFLLGPLIVLAGYHYYGILRNKKPKRED